MINKIIALSKTEKRPPDYIQCIAILGSIILYGAYLIHVIRTGDHTCFSITMLIGGLITYTTMFWSEIILYKRWYIIVLCIIMITIIIILCCHKIEYIKKIFKS
jgi:hypothetical protein